MRGLGPAAALAAILLVGAAPADPPQAGPAPFDPAPWLADLAQARVAVDAKYANLEWLTVDRGVDLDALFARAAARMAHARDAAEARAVLDRLFQRFGDGHVDVVWPAPGGATSLAAKPAVATPAPATPAGLCASIDYAAGRNTPGSLRALPGYAAIGDGIFPAGVVHGDSETIGILRIGSFDVQDNPALCIEAVAQERIDPATPCDDVCRDRIITDAFAGATRALADRLTALDRAGATVLVIDAGGNGGGSEWAEALARMLTPVPLASARLGFVRGPHWARYWRELAGRLDAAARTARGGDRIRLRGWAGQARAALTDAETRCAVGTACTRIAYAGSAVGLVAAAPAGAFAGRDWGVHVFNPAQFPYRDGVWSKPLIVYVDNESWSATEQFAALLQDNRAATILGTRTGGAGCGHTYGGTPTTLTNSGAILELPDCVRLRADGSNEVAGVVPDVLVGLRANDGDAFKARLVAAALPAAIAQARALRQDREGRR